jgi:cytochrome P450
MSDLDIFRMMREPGFYNDPHPHLRRLRENDPVHRSQKTGIWFLTRHADCVTHMRSPKFGRDLRLWNNPSNQWRPENTKHDPVLTELFAALQPQMLNSNPPAHTRQRKVFQPAFVPAAIREMEPVVRAVADTFIAELADGELRLMQQFAEVLPVAVIAGLFEVPSTEIKSLKAWSDAIAPMVEAGVTQAQKVAAFEGHKEFFAFIEELVAHRRKHPGKGLIDRAIAAANEDGALSHQELINNIVTLLSAGHETATNLIANSLLHLTRNPDQLRKLRADPALFPSTVEEVLRYEPPVNANMRVAIEDVEVGGKTIPAGALCFSMTASANRDPEVFARPDEFDISRQPNPHLSFGGGIHHCIGASLGRLEGRIALEGLLRRFARIELVEEPEWRRRVTVRGMHELVLHVA